jgi:TP901 family phage tail tape measure protein
MADETISTRIVANADFSALIADVHRVTASLSKLQQELASSNKMLANQIAVMNRSFSDTLRSTGQYSTHFVSLQSDVEKFGKNLDGGKLKLNQYFNAFRDQARTSGGLIRDLAKQQVALQNAVLQPLGRNAQGLMQFNVHVPRGLDEVKNKTAIARQELQIMNKVIQDGAGQLINWGKNTQWAGRQLTVGLTVPLVAFGKAAADAFKQADQELVRLTKVYGDVAGTSAEELGRVRDDVSKTAKEISAAMGVSFKETIGLAADIAATGKTGDELLGSIKETTRLAVLGEVDRQEAMKATLAIQSAFKQNTDELSKSINFLNAVENQTSTTLNDLVEAIPKAGPVIKGLGGSVQDLALYLTAMREGGINAAEGANALKSALASLINPTDVAVEKFQTLGIDLLGIVNNNAGDLTGTLMTLQAALDNLDPLQKQQAIEQLFGKFQFARLNALFENLGRQGSQTLQVLDLMKASSEDLAAVAGRELSAVTESASGKYRRAIESLRASLAEVGEQFLQINTVLIQVIDKVVQFANNLPGPVKQVLALAGGFTAVIGPVIMLTGVLANFFGYILKGIFHLKSFFKGSEGWKYLTPEMLAAEKAGRLVEQSFYSDAKAAAVLKQALGNLIDEFSILEAKAKSGAMSVNPAVSTMAGNLIMAAGGSRVVNPNHPLAGAQGTRASSHMVPRSSMTEAQRMQQTMFGMVPGSIPVNQKIGQNPQIYMNEQLPNVPGLTTVGGVSTGIVSGEAARHHAMMATLAMQSKVEIAQLKQTIAATGTVSRDFMNQFDDILPIVSKLTDNAARESALIVAELRAGKISIEAARAKIVALNLETERMIASSMQTQATLMGRTINPTMVPTLNQPVVDPTGKSNMRELFKKGKTRDFINRIAAALGVRTSGAGYNIETTVPKKFNMGGLAMRLAGRFSGRRVPGPNVNKDIVPAVLTPGEFVVNAQATRANLPLLQAINNARGGRQYPAKALLDDAGIPISRLQNSVYPARQSVNLRSRGGAPITASSYLDEFADPNVFKMTNAVLKKSNLAPLTAQQHKDINAYLRNKIDPNINITESEFGRHLTHAYLNAGVTKDQLRAIAARNTMRLQFPGTGTIVERRNNLIDRLSRQYPQGRFEIDTKSNNNIIVTFPGQKPFKLEHEATRSISRSTGGVSYETLRQSMPAGARGEEQLSYAHLPLDESLFMNMGGMIPGYNMGGMVMPRSIPVPAQNGKYNMGGIVQGYNEGGEVGGFRQGFETARNKNRGTSGVRGMSAMGSTGMFMGGMGLSMAGSAVGGTAGMIMNSAGMAMQFLPMLSGLKSVMGGLTKVTALAKTFGSLAGTIFRIAGTAVKFFTGPVGLAVLAVTGLVTAFKIWRKNVAENKREQTNMFGLTEKGAEELGIKYKSLTERMKDLREEQKLQKDAATAAFEAYTSSGVTGLSLTIKELKELKKQAKESMPELISTFNSIDSSKVNEMALNLKSQMVASGKSVQEATNLIYALIEASDKAGMGVSAISTKAFTAVVDKGTAANQIVENFVKNIDNVSNIEPEAFSSNLDSVVTSVEAAIQALVGTKDESNNLIDEAKAVEIQMERLNDSGLKNKQIGKDALEIIKKQRPEFANILKSSDTIGGMIAKWRIHLSGVYVDLKNITSEQAIAMDAYLTAQEAAQNQIATGETSSKVLGAAAKAAKDLGTQIKNNNQIIKNAEKGTGLLSKAAIKGYQDEIKAIRERAEAKKKALRETFDKENAELELQKAKLDLQNAIARGDNEAAAAAQIRIQQIQKEASLKAAEAKIDENAKKAEGKIQAKLDANQAKVDAAADKVATAGKSNENAAETKKEIDRLMGIVLKIAADQSNVEKIKDPVKRQAELNLITGRFNTFLEELEKASDSVQKYFPEFVDTKTNKAFRPTVTEVPGVGTFTTGKDAKNQLNMLSKEVSDQTAVNFEKVAESIKGGKSLGDIYVQLGGKKASTISFQSDAEMKAVIAKNAGTSSSQYKNPYEKDKTYLTEAARSSIIVAKKLQRGDTFTDPNGNQYKVTDGYDAKFASPRAIRMSMGGYIKRAVSGITGMTSSQPYLVGERGPELFVPSSGGQIIPNNLLGPKYNIPNGSITGVNGMSSTSSSNIVYNIDIDLNGTNVTADDIMRKFKSELALINAKEGRVRTLGGNY